MHKHLIGIEAWMLPSALRVRHALTKAEFSSDENSDGFLVLCESMFLRISSGFIAQELQQLRAMGLIAEPDADQAIENDESALIRLRCGTAYWDYSDPMAMARDAADMLRYAKESQHDVLSEACDDGFSHVLHSAPARALSSLAHRVFDTWRTTRFHHESVSWKLIPSLGGRHGLSVFLRDDANTEDGSRWISIGDDGGDGGDVTIRSAACPIEEVPKFGFPYIVICADFERYQWRYRNAWIYQCIYLDLGHAVAALKLLAHEDGQTLRFEHARSDAMGTSRELTHEPLIRVAFQ